MKIIRKEAAERILEPYMFKIRTAFEMGWNDWLEVRQLDRRVSRLSARARSNLVYAFVEQRVREIFTGERMVSLSKSTGILLMNIAGKLVIRFKKMARDGRTSNVDTRQQYLFSNQMMLPGLERETRLNAGYILDDSQRRLVRLLITCPMGRRVLWSIPIPGSGEVVAQPLPFATPSAVPTMSKTEVKLKSKAKRKAKNA